MNFVICQATNKQGMPCKAFAVAGGRVCRFHGGMSTGPRTPMGKLRVTLTLLAHKANGAPKGHVKGDVVRSRRERSARSRAHVVEHQERRAARLEHWRRRKDIAAGLPLYSDNDAAAAHIADTADPGHSSE